MEFDQNEYWEGEHVGEGVEPPPFEGDAPAPAREPNPEELLNEFNQSLRANPDYREFQRSIGVNPDAPMHLSDQQRRRAAGWLAQQGFAMPEGLEIDPAGNLNQNEGFGKQLKKWGPIVAQGALAFATGGMSLPVSMAINGAAGAVVGGIQGGVKGAVIGGLTGAGAAAGGHYLQEALAGTQPLASSSIPGLHEAVPGAITSQGVSSTVPLASSTIPGLHLAVPGAISSQNISSLIGTLPSSSIPGLHTAVPGGPSSPAPLPSGSIPGLHEAVPPAIESQGISEWFHGLAPLPSGSIDGLHEAVPQTPPNQHVSSTIPPEVLAGGSNAVLDWLKNKAMDPKTWLGAATLFGPQIADAFGGGNHGPSRLEGATNPFNTPDGGGSDLPPAQSFSVDAGPAPDFSVHLPPPAAGGPPPSDPRFNPALDALVLQAYGMTPTRYRGAAPEGFRTNTGGYGYTAPRFGGS